MIALRKTLSLHKKSTSEKEKLKDLFLEPLNKELGYREITAITLNDEDVEATRKRDIDCYKMDMTFLVFEDKIFDALWVRNALEHSPFPYLILLEFNRVLKPGGFIYVEMPMPDAPRVLENWPNHYSVFGDMSMFCRKYGTRQYPRRI
jgi:ubiquinone/menaquinone biosynthesis C-methylase UbiE